MKIGILNSDFINYHESDDLSYENKRIIRHARELFDECILIDPTQITVHISHSKVEVVYNKNGDNIIPTLDCILIRRTRGFSEQIYDIVRAIKYIYPKLILFDPAESFDTPVSKVSSFLKRYNYFNQPNTLIVLNPNNPNIDTDFSYPVIVKPTHGFKGRYIKKCGSPEEVKKYIKDTSLLCNDVKECQTIGYGFLVQEFIDFEDEFRINVINDKSIGCVKKITNNYVKNADRGAVFVRYYDSKAVAIAEKCAQKSALFFAGVDIGKVKNEYYVLECNRNPAFEHFDEALNINTAHILMQNIYDVVAKSKSAKSANIDGPPNIEKEPPKQSTKNSSSNIAFQQPNYGNIFVNSTHIGHNLRDSRDADVLIDKLLRLIENAAIGRLAKQDIVDDLISLKTIKDQQNETDILNAIQRRIENVNSIISAAGDIGAKAYPLLKGLASIFNIEL